MTARIYIDEPGNYRFKVTKSTATRFKMKKPRRPEIDLDFDLLEENHGNDDTEFESGTYDVDLGVPIDEAIAFYLEPVRGKRKKKVITKKTARRSGRV